MSVGERRLDTPKPGPPPVTLTAMHFSKAVILSWATSSRIATYM